MNLLARLEMQHRLEEVAERFGLRLDVADDALHLPFARLSHARVEGRPLDLERGARRAAAAGLEVAGEGLRLPLDGDAQAAEDALLAFLSPLLEADPKAFLGMPVPRIHVPADGSLPQSAVWLERFYGGDFLPREKKPAVVDLRHCQGPFLRSVDDDPLQIVDAASQIASLAAGFRPGRVQAALDEGAFDPYLVAAHDVRSPEAAPAVEAFVEGLLEVAAPGLEHVCLVNGGAEANEKAFHIAQRHGPGGKRVLAFEGSFHGRTLLSLYATWNPVKRAPYELPGYEATFLPWPAPEDPYADPPIPAGWRHHWSNPERGPATWGSDPLLQTEAAILEKLAAEIRAGDVLCCVVEPYQCEGGDRPATRRFFHGLRALTRAHGVPLIFDEVQIGFGLSGRAFWHHWLRLVDVDGRPDAPDLVTGAKRAQVGYVLSRWPDPDPGPTHVASALRGAIHLDIVSTRTTHALHADQRLEKLVHRWPDVVSRPRVYGDAFAFDLPDGVVANKLIAQRFYRGYMVYIAGENTLRYRMNRAMRVKDVDAIFDAIEASIEAMVTAAGGPGPDLAARMAAVEVPEWSAPPKKGEEKPPPTVTEVLLDETGARADVVMEDFGTLHPGDRAAGTAYLGLPADVRGTAARQAIAEADADAFEAAVGVPLLRFAADVYGTRVRRIDVRDFDALADQIYRLEAETYEPIRQEPLADLRVIVAAADSVCLVAEDPQGLVGMAFAAPLELWPDLDGPRQDPHRGADNTLYSADLTVAGRVRGRGVGRRLRVATLREALRLRHADGRPRYAYVTGRNKLADATAMWTLNRRFGAYEVDIFAHQYDRRDGMARYYRIPLRRHDRRALAAPTEPPARLDLGCGVHLPLGVGHPALDRARDLGVFDEPALTKLTVSNFITPGFARYAEYVRAIAPAGNAHLYFTSCPDEMVDKSIRALKHNRKDGRLVVGVEGGFHGTNTAAARSLTDGADAHFDWPRVPHPGDDGSACVAALDALVEAHGAEALIGVYLESVQARTGRSLTPAAWKALCAWRDRTGVPLVLQETTTGLYRNGAGRFFWVDAVEGDADVVLWWAGGQIGHVFSNDRTFVPKPLTLISTWDGDELSAARLLRAMYVARGLDAAERATALDAALERAGAEAAGAGLYRVLTLEAERADAVAARLAEAGIALHRPTPTALVVAPPLTVTDESLARLAAVLGAALEAR